MLPTLQSLFSQSIGIFVSGVGNLDPTGQVDPLLGQVAALLSSIPNIFAHLS